ncbi:UNKNOWN [Stylonychia lemnae]|uniref:Uncharacterized protein n=1 Tax=Stylonychia lemnae TaxID=5949 RepID=A0A077ZVC6_STYLE|nr:UNKNOWN [Stylonychia lemnae]|eukprot:CDW73850.1 UNKNOWN [Stylonychia lemnae]
MKMQQEDKELDELLLDDSSQIGKQDQKQQVKSKRTVIAKKGSQFKQIQDFQEFADDVADQIQSFYENCDKIQELYPKLRINQINNFKNDIDDIVGFELDELHYYMTRVHHLSLTKFVYTWQEFMEKVLPAYGRYATRMRVMGRDNYYLVGKDLEEGNIQEEEDQDEDGGMKLVKNSYGAYEMVPTENTTQDKDQNEEEKAKLRSRGQEIFQMKLDKHFDKIKEVFLQCCGNKKKKDGAMQTKTTIQTINETDAPKDQMKLIKLNRFVDDLAYICGLVFIYFERYLANGIIDQRSQKEFVKKLKHKLWLEAHEEAAKSDQKLKHNMTEIIKSQKIPASQASSRKSQPLLPVLKKKETNFDQKINENREDQETKIRFEDELYKKEKNDMRISFDMFVRVLENIFEEDTNLVAIDSNHELDEYFKQQLEYEKHMNDDNYDPFQNELQQQIEHYEKMLGINQMTAEYPPLNMLPKAFEFKSQNEKDITVKLLEHAKQQLADYLQAKANQIAYLDMKSNQNQTLEQMRQRSVRQIFYFYTGQHWKWNMSFDQLMEKKSLLDFGEFNIFCKDFKVPLPKSKIQIVFKKCSVNHRPHELEQFSKALETLGVEVNTFKIEQMEKRLEEIGKIEKLRRERQMKKIEKVKRLNDGKQFHDLLQKLEQSAILEEEKEDEANEKEKQNKEEKPPKDTGKSVTEETKKDADETIQWDNLQNQTVNLDESIALTQAPIVGQQEGKARRNSQMSMGKKSIIPTQSVAKASMKSQQSNRTQNRLAFEEQLQLDKLGKLDSRLPEPISVEKIKLQQQVNQLKAKTERQLIDEFFEFLELHDLTLYRVKLKGLRVNPFDMRDNYQRIAAGEMRNRELQRAKLTADQIREKVQVMRDKRLREQKVREMREKKKQDDQRVQQQKAYELNRKKRASDEAQKMQQLQQLKHGISQPQPVQLGEKQTYMDVRNKQLGIAPEDTKNLKLTLEDLERMNYEDIWENKPDDFKPSDFFNESRKKGKGKKHHSKARYDKNNQGQNLNDSVDSTLHRMVVGDESFDNRNEKLYNIKKERKQQEQLAQNQQNNQNQNQQKKIRIDNQPKTQGGAVTERSKRGGNQPLQNQQPGRRRGTTPDLSRNHQQQQRSKSNHKVNKSLNKSSISGHSKSPKRKQSMNPKAHQSLDLQSMKNKRSGSSKNLLAGLQPNSVKNQKMLAIQYPGSVIQNKSNVKTAGGLGVSHSVANLKQKIAGSQSQVVPYNPKHVPMTQIQNNKYKVNEQGLIKAQQLDSKQKIKANINMANILKMHDKQIEKGLNTARR